ncbi:MAG: transposase [Solimicrobium sp.]|jgi:transposase InsO family protein|nr:transposase [Solimicrobium sp.]
MGHFIGVRRKRLGCVASKCANIKQRWKVGLQFKKEQVHPQRYATRQATRLDIFEYIEVFYNKVRRYSKINNQSPDDFEQQWLEKQKKKVV